MFPLKRKIDDIEDSDDEGPLGRQILPVANLPKDFDGEPADGMQYLFTVRRDAHQLPHVTRAVNPYESKEPIPLAQACHDHTSLLALPSDEWRTSFIKHFNNFRKNSVQPAIHVGYSPRNKEQLMPDKKQRDLWWAFLAGKPESEWNLPKKPKKAGTDKKRPKFGGGMRAFASDSEHDTAEVRPTQETWYINDRGEVESALRENPTEALPTPSGSPPPDLNDLPAAEQIPDAATSASNNNNPPYIPREPTPLLLHHIDQRCCFHLLMYFTHWINLHLQQQDPSIQLVLTESHACWIFVLLSRIEDYVTADDMSLLRNLARACASLLKERLRRRIQFAGADERKHIGRGVTLGEGVTLMSERSCWTIIAAIVGVWGQKDLWDETSASLMSV